MSNSMTTNLSGVPIPSVNWRSENLPEEFRKFKRSCEFIFNGPLKTENEEVKVQYLMMWAGPDAGDIRDGWDLTDAQSKSLEAHWTRFQSYISPKSSFRVYRFKLRSLKQEEESIDAFLTRCRMVLSKCDYNAQAREIILLDTLIAGVKDETVQRKLIAKDATLTLDRAMDIIRAYEQTTAQMQDISEPARKMNEIRSKQNKPKNKDAAVRPKISATNATVQPTFPLGTCWRCGKQHKKSETCSAAGVQCHKCQRTGHYARVCMQEMSTNAQPNGQKSSKQWRKPKKVHEVKPEEASGFSFDTINVIDTISGNIVKHDEAFANIQMSDIKKKPVMVKCKIDTGAQSNVMPVRVYKELFPNESPEQLKQSNHKLTAYGGAPIKQYGICKVKCAHQGRVMQLPFFVTEAQGSVMLGLKSCTDLGLVTLNCDASQCSECNNSSDIHTVKQQEKNNDLPCSIGNGALYGKSGDAKADLLKSEPTCFSFSEGDVGTFPGEYHITMTENAKPVVNPPRRVPDALHEKLKQKLEFMEKKDIIRKVEKPTDWVNSVVIATKSNGDLRICLDPRSLNKAIKREYHYTPTLEDILPKLANAHVFTKLDARSGYWTIRLDEESQQLTTFSSPFGRYCFMRLPFGLVCSQDAFQRRIDIMIDGLEGVVAIADDILIFGKNETEHDQNLKQLMKRAKEHHMKFNVDKCDVKKSKVNFFGHFLTTKGLEIDPNKVKAIMEMPRPTSLSELRTLMGMINYLSKFVSNLSQLTSPLRDLLRKDVDFQWMPNHDKAFQKMKLAICEPKVLAYFDGQKPIVIQTDASMRGLGSTLMQDGRPVAYASKSLSQTEMNYSNIEREMLGVVFGLQHFHHYVFGRKVCVETDHKPLEAINKKNLTQAPPRLQRMLLKIQPYDVEIRYKPGRDIPVADALSRAPIPGKEMPDMDIQIHSVTNVSLSRLENIRKESEKSKELCALKDFIHFGWPESQSDCPEVLKPYWPYRDEISTHDGVCVKGSRVIIPECMRKEVLMLIHAGHQGIQKCRLRARNTVFWPMINADIDKMIRSCSACQANQTSQQAEPLMNIETDAPWSVVGTDLFQWNSKQYIIVVDYYSNFPVVRQLGDTTSHNVVNCLRSIFAEFGIPDKVISDNGPQYSSAVFSDFAQRYNFIHTTSSPHFPQSNGKAERHVGTVKKTLQKALESKMDPHLAMLALRTTPLGPNQPTPAELLFGRRVQGTLPMLRTKDNTIRSTGHTQHQSVRGRTLPCLSKGQYVRIQDPVTKKWKPGIVVCQRKEPRSYDIQQESGVVVRRNRRHIRTTGETFPWFSQTLNIDSDSNTDVESEHEDSVYEDSEQEDSTPDAYVTRAGRRVKAPDRLDL